MNKDVLEEIIRVETLKKIRSIFEQMQVIRYSCYIDSLARIDEEIYDCDNCILADTVNTVSTVREGMTDKSICPMIMKEEVNDVIR